MTRAAAALLSIFGSLFPAILLIIVSALYDNKLPNVVMVIAIALFVVVALTIRIYFTAWYARDKGRSGALGWLAIFGILG